MEYVIGGLALLFVLCVSCVVVGVVAVVRAVRAVRRRVQRTTRQVRRTVEDVSLRAKTAQPGAVGELARIRLGLRSSLAATRQALESGARADGSLHEALRLLDRLEGHARQLDGELRLLMDEPDRRRLAARLPEARERADRIRGSADSLRWAAQDRARRLDEEALGALDEQIHIETQALRHWESGGPGEDAAPGTPGGADRRTTAHPPGRADGAAATDPAGTAPEESAGPSPAALPRTTPAPGPNEAYPDGVRQPRRRGT